MVVIVGVGRCSLEPFFLSPACQVIKDEGTMTWLCREPLVRKTVGRDYPSSRESSSLSGAARPFILTLAPLAAAPGTVAVRNRILSRDPPCLDRSPVLV